MEMKAGHFAKQMKAESWQLKCGSEGTLNISWKQKRSNASILCELDIERQLLEKS